MKQNLRLWGLYGLKRTQSVSLTKGRLYLPDYAGKPNRYSLFRRWVRTYISLIDRCTDNKNAVSAVASAMLRDRSQTAAVVLGVYERFPGGPRAGFQQRNSKMMAGIPHEDPTMIRSLSGTGTPLGNVHTEAARLADGGHGKAQPIPRSSPPSLIPYPCDIPMIPVCISVKRPKDGTLPKGIRQTYGKNAHSDRQSVGLGPGWDCVRDRFESASEVSLHSMQPCTALRLSAPNGVQSERKINPVEDQTKHPSHPEGNPVRRRSAVRPLTARDWFEYSRVLVRQLFACASAFSRSVAEGFSKASRTLVEALSKDCRTSLEQQSNNSRRNIEESCVCTHAMVPARSGLGLALGLVIFLLAIGPGVHAQTSARQGTSLDNIQPLQIGDTIPEALWQLPLQVVNHPDGRDTITLNDYRDKKLIILDFWATWCKSCIEGFPKLAAFQKKYENDLGVLLVNAKQTGDDSSRIDQLFSRYSNLHDYSLGLPYLSLDTVFQTLFPHRVLPHMVWLSGDGIYLVATYSSALTSANIESASSGNVKGIHMKHDMQVGTSEEIAQDRNVIYRSELTGYVEGAGFKARRLTYEGASSVYRIKNYSLRYIYGKAYNDVMKGIPQNQWIFNGVDATVVRGLTKPKGFEDSYCYELRMPGKITVDWAENLMREELERVFGVSVSRTTKDSRVLVLQVTPKIKNIMTKGKIQQRQLNPAEGPIFFRNVSLEFVLRYISKLLGVPTIRVGDEGISVDVTLPSDVANLDEKQLVKLLENMGIDVREEKRPVEFAVFTNLNNNISSTK